MKNLIIVLFLLLFNFIYSCTQKEICNDGLKLLYLIRFNIDKKNKCITSINDLEDISKKMFDLENHILENPSLKFWYARYLCSQYSVINDFIVSDDISKYTEKISIENMDDLVTKNYIKGLDLLAQLCFLMKESNIDYDNEFINYLSKLEIDDHCIGEYIDELEKLLNLNEAGINQLEDKKNESILNKFISINIANSLKNRLYNQKDDFILEDILKGIFNLLRKTSKPAILDAFLKYYVCSSHKVMQNKPIAVIQKLYQQKEHLSEYMKFIYSYIFDSKKIISTKNSKFIINNEFKLISTVETKEYLLSVINNNNGHFEFSYVGYKTHRKLAKFFESSKDKKNAIIHYNHALNYQFKIDKACYLAKIYFDLEDYKNSLSLFKKARKKIKYEKESKSFKYYFKYYLELLELKGDRNEYEKELLDHNKEVMSNRIKKNKRYVAVIRKKQKLNALKEKQLIQTEQKREANRLKMLNLAKEEENKDIEDYTIFAPLIENLKKEYSEKIIKKKTHSVADPNYIAEEIVITSRIEKPLVRIEQLISGNSIKIFRKLFGPYESSPIVDRKQNISRKDVKTLMDALGFSYSFSEGKGSHSKGIIKSVDKDGNKEEYMIIIPCDGPNIKFYCIKSLRDSFLAIDFYPKDLKESLNKAGLLK